MLSSPAITRLKIAGAPFAFFLLAVHSPFSYGAPKEVNINNEHIFLNTPQDEEAVFNITNGGSLTVSSTTAGFSSTTQSHTLDDATLTLNSEAVFSGDITSANSHILFSYSTYSGNIRAAGSESLGDVYINSSLFNGGIRTGANNAGYTITVKDSTFQGQGFISPLAIYSGGLVAENSTLYNHNFVVADLRNVDSAIMQNIKIVNTSDYTGPSALGVAGIYMEDTHNADILNSDIYSAGTAIRVRNSAEDDIVNNLLIKNSTLKAEAAAALEATNSNLIIYASSLDSLSDGSAIACYAGSAAVNGCGALNLEGTNVLVSQHSAINSNNVGVFITGKKETQLDIIDSTINAQKAAFSVNKGDTTIAVYNSRASIKLTPSITSKENRLLEALDGSKVDFSLYNVYTRGDIFADESSRVNVLLSGASLLEGNIAGVDTLEISRNASWKMTADNHLKEMLFTGGSILLPDVGPNNQFHTLTIESLTGAGLFGLNTNLQTMQGDKLNITKDLYGTFLLRIANSGTEPEDADAMLKVVQAPSNTALFALYGGKVDAGVWQYDLVQKGNDWYLANSNRPNTPDSPDVPDAPDAPDHGGTPPSQPSLTPSANAVLNMAAAPVTIFNNELQNLRQRRGDGKSGEEGGVWGRYIHQNARINSGISSWRLGQNGFELGGDKAVAVREGDLFVGVMASITNNSVRDDRGGNSQIDSYSAGAYASWFADSGLYIDAVVKANRFNNRLHTQMSDGTAVSGGYNQNGLGGALESGWHIALADDYWVEPFARLSAFRAGGKSVTLSNGMKAQIRQPSSLQAETGLQFGKRIQLEKASLNPYLKASVTHEFVKTGKVWLNDSWDFNEGAAATSGRYGAGIDIRLTKDASLFTEVDYQKGRTIESTVTANLGFRLNF